MVKKIKHSISDDILEERFGPLQIAWLKALRSGKYKQGKHYLHDKNGWCCLGVACDVSGAKEQTKPKKLYGAVYGKSKETTILPSEVVKKMKFVNQWGGEQALTTLNDADMPFKSIATLIEQFPSTFFEGKA